MGGLSTQSTWDSSLESQVELTEKRYGSPKHLVHAPATKRKGLSLLPSFRHPQWCHSKVQHEHLSTILPRVRRQDWLPEARLNQISSWFYKFNLGTNIKSSIL